MEALKKLQELLTNSVFLSKEDISDFLLLIPNMTEQEIIKIVNFLELAEQKLEKIHKKYNIEEQSILKQYSLTLDKNADDAKKQLITLIEDKSLKEDYNKEESLLKEFRKYYY